MTDRMKALGSLGRAIALTVILALVAGTAPGWAQEEGEARLGGGSDLSATSVVPLPQGGRIPPIHYLFADNPEDEPIRVAFRADAPAGITVDPEWEERTVPAHGRVENHFGIAASQAVAAGDYRVVVQLVRSDIDPEPGRVTALPAVQASFTVAVSGERAAVVVRAVSGLTGEAVSGTLSLSALGPEGGALELHRAQGSSLEAEVAPGSYRAAFLLGERTVAARDFAVAADETAEVVLEVETVSFVLAALRPVEEAGRPVVAELVAGVSNEAEAVEGPVRLRVVVFHQGAEVDSVALAELPELAPGLTDASVTYRPEGSWQTGTYRFRFELVSPAFTLAAPEEPSMEVTPFALALDPRLLVALGAAGLLLVLILGRLLGMALGRQGRRRKGRRHRRRAQAEGDLEQPAHPGPDAPPGPSALEDGERKPTPTAPAESGPDPETGPAPPPPAEPPGPSPEPAGSPVPETTDGGPSPSHPARWLPDGPPVPPQPPPRTTSAR